MPQTRVMGKPTEPATSKKEVEQEDVKSEQEDFVEEDAKKEDESAEEDEDAAWAV